jgi:SET domain-containing protein
MIARGREPSPLYPFPGLDPAARYPTTAEFEITNMRDSRGNGVRALKKFSSGEMLAKISGVLMTRRQLHTLQVNPSLHLYDPHFAGMLLHSCEPNAFLDMYELELWCLKDILPGSLVTVDYPSTEDVLSRQFACQCGAKTCRTWITGRKEWPVGDGERDATLAEKRLAAL